MSQQIHTAVKSVYVTVWQADWSELINSDGRWRRFCIGYSLAAIGPSEGSASGATERGGADWKVKTPERPAFVINAHS